jgi:parvulin-like peptidyl-prolyl isomerase
MANKATTGGPVRRKRTPEQEERRTYLSRAEREARYQRWVLLGIGAAIGVILLVLLAGVVYEGLIFPNQPIAVVNGETITTAEFQARVRLVRWQTGRQLIGALNLYGVEALSDQNHPLYQQLQQIYQQLYPGQENIIGEQVLNEMIEDILLRQQAEEMGISVDPELVEAQVQDFFGYDPNPETPTPTLEPTVTPTPIVSPTPSPTPTGTPTPEATEEGEAEPTATATPVETATPFPTLTADEQRDRYEESVEVFFEEGAEESGLSREEIMAIFEAQVLRTDLLYEAITGDLPRIEEQADARHILVTSEQEAEDVMTALAEGESFTALARYASADTGSGFSGGELGWAGRGLYAEEFEDAIFNGEVGAIFGPVETQFGFHIIQVHAREERELTDSQYDQRRQQTFLEWVDGLRADEATTIEIFDYADRTPGDPGLLEMGLLGTGAQ